MRPRRGACNFFDFITLSDFNGLNGCTDLSRAAVSLREGAAAMRVLLPPVVPLLTVAVLAFASSLREARLSC